MTSDAELQAAASSAAAEQVQVLLVEDDDGDALLVGELLREVGAAVAVRRARSLTQAKTLVPGAACVLLDLGLPDSRGLNGLRKLLRIEPEAAVVVLTGEASDHLGEQAVRAGAQDYLVKGEVSGHMLNRVIRYAVERRRAEDAQRALHVAEIRAQENARLERGLLPSPLLTDPRLSVAARCLPGGKHHLLGGDFYDAVEASDGWVHALIGDVCGRGPAEAALGVCLRVAWRAMVLAGRPAGEILATLCELLEHERQDDTMFATLCMTSVSPDRDTGWVRMAGHLPPLLVTGDGVAELQTPPAAPLGLSAARDWPATQVRLPGSWSMMLYTDGLIEGRIGKGSERLGSEGLIGLIRDALGPVPPDTVPADTVPPDAGPPDAGPPDTGPPDTGPPDTGPPDTGPADAGPADAGPADAGPPDTGPADAGTADAAPRDGGRLAGEELLDRIIDRVRELNGGDLDDDLAVLSLSLSPPDAP